MILVWVLKRIVKVEYNISSFNTLAKDCNSYFQVLVICNT